MVVFLCAQSALKCVCRYAYICTATISIIQVRKTNAGTRLPCVCKYLKVPAREAMDCCAKENALCAMVQYDAQ